MKKLDTQKITLVSLTGLAVLGILYVTTVNTVKEVNKYKSAWSEIQFAKQHPALVKPMREYYERGVKALETLTVEQSVPTPTTSK